MESESGEKRKKLPTALGGQVIPLWRFPWKVRVGRRDKVTNSSRRAAGSPVEVSVEDKRCERMKSASYTFKSDKFFCGRHLDSLMKKGTI